VSGPRNRKLYCQGQRHREQIRMLMLDYAQRNPLARSASGKYLQQQMRERHGVRLGLSTIYWHVDAIRLQALIEPLSLESIQCIE
jgi:hypothetical protein